MEKTYSDRILLCGDSSGFVNPLTGEGIYYAMSSGEIAAQVILEALDNDDMSEQFLSKYQTNWQNDFGKDLSLLFKLSYNWEKEVEKIIRLLNKDKKLLKLVFAVLHGRISISEYKRKIIMQTIKLCSRCHENFIYRPSRYGQICPWCEQSMIDEERDLCRACGIKPMTKREEIEYLRDWESSVLFNLI